MMALGIGLNMITYTCFCRPPTLAYDKGTDGNILWWGIQIACNYGVLFGISESWLNLRQQ